MKKEVQQTDKSICHNMAQEATVSHYTSSMQNLWKQRHPEGFSIINMYSRTAWFVRVYTKQKKKDMNPQG